MKKVPLVSVVMPCYNREKYHYSDCDDRVALFYYLVKEIYNLPMIALLYPTHVTMAVPFDKPVGAPVLYKGKKYSICEPTP
jgi:hypothetical protein